LPEVLHPTPSCADQQNVAAIRLDLKTEFTVCAHHHRIDRTTLGDFVDDMQHDTRAWSGKRIAGHHMYHAAEDGNTRQIGVRRRQKRPEGEK
jgi:hypothetical protein